MNQELRITDENSGKRLDRVVVEVCPECSRSTVQRMIKEGAITVNEKKVSPHHFLKKDDVVVISAIEQKKEVLVTTAPLFRTVFECDEYVVIDKPAGLVVHAGIKHTGGTLVDQLLAAYPEMRQIGNDPVRPGIVHRLDKEASGVMVIARTQNSFESLQKQFKLRQVQKQYSVLAYGRVEPTQGVIDLPISRSKQQYTRRAAGAREGRTAVTRYTVERTIGNTSLVRVQPETGRTHQIRVHFFAKGNPLVGDPLYSSKKIKRIPSSRLMLHACFLAFHDLSGAQKEYTLPPGEDFQKMLSQIEYS